jgi:transcriptional regulator with PAS, ATPase and Fis domain
VELAQRVAKMDATVLVFGETGTGKELLARLIHRETRPNGPFVAVNLAAVPKELVESTLFGHEKGAFKGATLGKFELATGGTLFLDEIGDLNYEVQSKLLRTIKEGELERVGGTHTIKTDFRLITATNVDLEKAINTGRFREDLYYRLNVIPIHMPALRDRLEDLPDPARFFVRRYNVKFRKNVQGFTESALNILTSYWWPGNVRELENLIERLVVGSDKDWITDDDLPYELHLAKRGNQDHAAGENLFESAVSTFERRLIIRTLKKSAWNVDGASQALGIPLSTLKFKMDRYQISERSRRSRGAYG